MRLRTRSLRNGSVAAVLALAASAACGFGLHEAPDGRAAHPMVVEDDAWMDEVQNVILFIGDGVGTAYWTAAKWAADSLAVEDMAVAGLTDTQSADSRVTDSAAGATVYATGQRTYNGAIGVGVECAALYEADPDAVEADPASCDPLEGVFDVAHRIGMATGLVATSSLTHATPAAFGAKVPLRRMQPEIASQYAQQPIDVLLGGGLGFFDGTLRDDGENLLDDLCREAACLFTPEELAGYEPDDQRLVGLFAEDHMPPFADRSPTLPEMTRVALERLAANPRGFFVMVEGSQPDWRGHDNRPLPEVVGEMVDFDDAIRVALDFQAQHPDNTLVVVVADHETGGLSLVLDSDTVAAAYTTTGHTGSMTPHFAHGPGAWAFSGIMQNHEIGEILLRLVRTREARIVTGR